MYIDHLSWSNRYVRFHPAMSSFCWQKHRYMRSSAVAMEMLHLLWLRIMLCLVNMPNSIWLFVNSSPQVRKVSDDEEGKGETSEATAEIARN